MKKMQKILTLALALLLLLLLTACQEEVETLTLRVNLPHEVTTLDPAMVTTETEKTVVNHLYENLMKLVDDGNGGSKLAYGLASGYQYENNLDGTQTYTFTLRSNAVWADGRPVTAHDFVYSWRRLADPATESPNAWVLDTVAGYAEARKSGDMTKLQVSAADERTLVVVLSHKSLQFPRTVCADAVTMPVREDMVQAENWSMNPATLVANGPYCVVDSWQDGVLTVRSAETYYDQRRLGPEMLQFSCGVVDETADFTLTHAGVEENAGWTLGSLPYTGTLVMNQMTTFTEELRQAMSLTIDRQQISDLLGSVYVPAEGLIPAGVGSTQGGRFRDVAGALIDNDPEQYEARCQAAKELLKDQELPQEGNVSLIFVSDAATDQVAEALRSTWQEKLGLQVTLRAVTQEELMDALTDGDFAMALVMLESVRSDAADMLKEWTSAADGNYAHIHNSAYDLLLRITDTSASAEARDAYLSDAERLLVESGYVVPICYATDSWKLNETLMGVYGDGMGQYFFQTVTRKPAEMMKKTLLK